MTILKNRANIAQTLEEEAQGDAAQKHISAVIIKEILKAKQRGWNAARISKEYNLDHSVVEKLGNQYAIPIFNKEGIVLLSIRVNANDRVNGQKRKNTIDY